MSKMLFFDIDGTLIECNKGIYEISPANEKSLDLLKENGHDVFLATGRCKCFIVDGVNKYPFSGYVTCNGGYVEYKGEPVYKAIVPAEAIKKTMEVSEQLDLDYYFESTSHIYVRNKNNPKHQKFAKNWGMKDQFVYDEFDPDQIEVYIGMIIVNDLNDIPAMQEALSPYFDIQRHQSQYSFDLTIRGVSKAVGIEKLVEVLHRDIKDTIAFGDGRNDVEMLETVGTGVAMKNAMPEALEAANEICDYVENDGITSWLIEKGMIPHN